jgi:hypothetical protein
MRSFCELLAAVVAAGSFGAAVALTAATGPDSFHHHSGTQPYVRVIR